MLSITNHQQVNFKRNENKVSDSDIQRYEKVQDELNEDTFVSENIEQTNPRKRNSIPKFVRNILLGTALVGGLGAAAPKAEAQVPVGKVITEQKAVDPKDPSKGTATYYYSQKPVMDSLVINFSNSKRVQKYNTKYLNTYPEIKHSATYLTPKNKLVYSYTIRPYIGYDGASYAEDQGYHVEPEFKNLSGKELGNIKKETINDEWENRENRSSEYKLLKRYTPQPLNETIFNNPNIQGNIVKNGNRIIKSGKCAQNTSNPYTVTAYYTERPVLDSVIVKKPNGIIAKTKLDRDFDTKAVEHINYSDSRGDNADFWIEKDNNDFIKYATNDTNKDYSREECTWNIEEKNDN